MFKYLIKKSFLILFFSFFIFSSKIFSMGFQDQRSKLHQDFIDDISLSSWVSNADIDRVTFLKISDAFIDMMTEWSGNDFLWINNEIPKDNKINYIFQDYRYCDACDRRIGKTFVKFDYLLNYIAKWILPKDHKPIFLGDIHGNFSTITEILKNFLENKFINKKMHLAPDRILVFLGDCIDRGKSSLKVFTTAMLLAVKNPGKVFLLKGNHEDICCSYGSNLYGFKTEVERIESDDLSMRIVNNLAKAFEFLPAALLVGYVENCKFKCQFCAHAGPDIRINHRKFSAVLPNDQANGVWLKEISRDDFFSEAEFKKLISGYLKSNPSDGTHEMEDFLASLVFDQKDVIAYFNNSCVVVGYLWNDIGFWGVPADNIMKSSGRGDGLIRVHYNFIKYFFGKMNNENAEVVGIIRGHEHSLPKYILQLEQGLSQIPYAFCTPAIGTMFRGKAFPSYKLLQYNAANCFSSNDFAVHTLISGCIGSCSEINYNPTFLEMSYLDNDQWLFIPHESCP